MTLPGTTLLRHSRRWLGRTSTTRIIEPLVADWQHDYRDAGSAAGRMRAWARGAAAATVAVSVASATRLANSAHVRPVLRTVALATAAVSADAALNARGLPLGIAVASIAASVASWTPVVVAGALWQSRRYARHWHIGVVVTVTSAVAAAVLTCLVTPALASPPIAHASEAAGWVKALGPAVFAVLSGTAAIAHMRSGRRGRRVFSVAYVGAGTLVCAAFLSAVVALRGQGVERTLALGLATAMVFVPAICAFAVVAETGRRRFIRTRGRPYLISTEVQ